MIDALWGHRRDGGPDDVESALRTLAVEARLIGAALGFVVETHFGVGYSARPVDRRAAP